MSRHHSRRRSPSIEHIWILTACAAFLACTDVSSPPPSSPDVTDDPDTPPPPPPDDDEVTRHISLLTYNVAGLPEPLSGSEPDKNTPIMSPLLSAYDVVLVQEDFAYHEELAADVDHPYHSEPSDTGDASSLGDGLNRFSYSQFGDHQRITWEECNGTLGGGADCLTPKGFSVATHVIDGIAVDVYNFHMDAGRGSKDHEARATQLAQLVRWIDNHSAERPLILAGDTNLKDEEDELLLESFLAETGIFDACRSTGCPEPERIDRVFIRGTELIDIAVAQWSVATEFVDSDGEPLSDHLAVSVKLELKQLQH